MKSNLGARAAREHRSLMAWKVLTREKWWRCVAQCLARAHFTSLWAGSRQWRRDPGPGHTAHQHTMSPEPSSINSYMLQAAVYGNRITQSLHSAFFCQLKTSTWIYMPRKGTCVGECSEIRPKSNLGRDQFSYIKLNIGLWIVIIFMLTRTTKT